MTGRTHGRVALLVALACASPAQSLESRKYRIDMPAGTLWQAAEYIQARIGKKVFLDSGIRPDAVRVPALQGKFTPEEIFERALANTSLWYRLVGENTGFQICYASRPECARPGIPEVLILSGESRNADILRTVDDIQSYFVIDRQTIERTGARSLDELFRALPFANTSTFAGIQSAIIGESQQLDLRGLGPSETLVLVNGRRIAGHTLGGDAMQPLFGIPIEAIHRIEIHLGTSSSLFGSNATAGSVNIILRPAVPGLRISATADTIPGTPAETKRFFGDWALRFAEDSGTVSLWAGYSLDSTLLTKDRDLTSAARARIASNNPDNPICSPPLAALPNVCSASGESLIPGQQVSSLYVSSGWKREDGLAVLLPNAGQYAPSLAQTAQVDGALSAIRPRSETKSGNASLHYEFASGLSIDTELGCAAIEQSANASGADFVNFRSVRLEAGARTNPFPGAVLVTAPIAAGDDKARSDYRICRGIAGLQRELPGQWGLRFEYAGSRTVFTLARPVLDLPPNAVGMGQINVLENSIDESSIRNALGTLVLPAIRSHLSTWSLLLAGPVGRSTGAPNLTLRLEQRREELVQNTFDPYLFIPATGSTQSRGRVPPQGETVRSVYGELQVPLAGKERRRVEAQLIARFDDYRVDTARAADATERALDFNYSTSQFSAFSWTTAVRFFPVRGLTLRGGYGTGFIAPSATDLSASLERLIDSPLFVDPIRGGEPIGPFTLKGGGNPVLKPEQSRNYTASIVFEPIESLRLALDFTTIKKKGGIYSLSEDFFASSGTLILTTPDRITRDPATGRITQIDITSSNLSRTTMRAWDFALDYSFPPMRMGELHFCAFATMEPTLSSRLTEMTPEVNNVGNGIKGPARTRAMASLTWVAGRWAIRWATRFTSRYRVPDIEAIQDDQGDEFVKSQSYHDLSGSYTFPPGTLGAKSLEVQLAGRNVFQTHPPLDVTDPSLTSRYGWAEVPGVSLTFRLTPW